VTYAVQPLDVGEWPVTGEMALWDAVGRRGRFAMNTLAVSVTGVCATATPSPTLTPVPTATATASATPTGTGTPSPTPRPEASPTRRSASLFLPVALRERCDPKKRKADVVLVLDTSSSMTGAKMAGAQRAARAFVAQLNLGNDRAGVVAFGDTARVVLSLSADRSALEAAIDSLTTAPGTRIDLGLEAALTVLSAAGTDEPRTRVAVLLTDGRQVIEPERAVDQASAARSAGVLVYAIGLGTDVDGPFLVGLAGDPRRYFFAPGEAELVGIYEQIAVAIPCPESDFWAGRR
jgi:uncharacterized protein YegL